MSEADELSVDAIANALLVRCKQDFPDAGFIHLLCADTQSLDRALVIVCTDDRAVEKFLNFIEESDEESDDDVKS